jgi:hypothetical protein
MAVDDNISGIGTFVKQKNNNDDYSHHVMNLGHLMMDKTNINIIAFAYQPVIYNNVRDEKKGKGQVRAISYKVTN